MYLSQVRILYVAMTLGTAAFHNPAGPTAVIMENTRVRSYDDAYIYPFEEENTPDETPVGFYPRAVRRILSAGSPSGVFVFAAFYPCSRSN